MRRLLRNYNIRRMPSAHGVMWLGAIKDYSEAIKVGPPNTALYFLRGTAHLEAGELAGAIADFEAGPQTRSD